MTQWEREAFDAANSLARALRSADDARREAEKAAACVRVAEREIDARLATLLACASGLKAEREREATMDEVQVEVQALRARVAALEGRESEPERVREPTAAARAVHATAAWERRRHAFLAEQDVQNLRALVASEIESAERAAGERVKRECVAVAEAQVRMCREHAEGFRELPGGGKAWDARAAGAEFIRSAIEGRVLP